MSQRWTFCCRDGSGHQDPLLEATPERFPMISRLNLLLLVAAAIAGAQSFTGRIVGTVSDSTGGVVPGAQVKATDVATNRTQTATANETGNYALSEMPRGEYLIEVSAPGFKQFVRRGIQLSVVGQFRGQWARSGSAWSIPG